MKSTDEKFLMLYSNCIPVKGYSRSVICDLQMQNYFFIPNSLYKVLTKKKTKTFFTHNDIPNEYKQFFIEKNTCHSFVRNWQQYLTLINEQNHDIDTDLVNKYEIFNVENFTDLKTPSYSEKSVNDNEKYIVVAILAKGYDCLIADEARN